MMPQVAGEYAFLREGLYPLVAFGLNTLRVLREVTGK
jgi:hypothetical protein